MNSTPLPYLDLPPSVERIFAMDGFRSVDIGHLFVCLWLPQGNRKAYVPIVGTPHYAFVRQVLTGQAAWPARGYDSYAQYIRLHPHPCTEERFMQLIDSFKENGYDAQTRPILVFRSWRRPWPLARWDVADGFHRLAVLAAMGERCVQVATLQQKGNVLTRFAGRLIRRVS